jgi:leader peptidase (prepilin peptidase)/N-methyltransferase
MDAARYGRHMRVIEVLVSVGLAALGALTLGPSPALVPALALAAVAPHLVRVDLAEHRLPNRLVVPALIAGAVGWGLSWLGPGWPTHGIPTLVPLVTAAVYGGVLFVLALFGGMGMGDVKLAAALGLASPTLVVAVGSPLLAFVFGGVAALFVLIRRGPSARIAFGPFLLAGYFGALIVVAVLRANA